ncbi:MAG: sensor domain-containing diguanylate cyclase [Chloroflexota bacterium]
MRDRVKRHQERLAPWLFLGSYGLALALCGTIIIQTDLSENLLIVFILPVLWAAFYFNRWVSWGSVFLLVATAIWTASKTSAHFGASLKTIAIAGLSEAVVIEMVYRLAQARHEATHRLRESQEKYQSLIEKIPIGIYRTDHEGLILHVNQTLAEMLGFENPEAIVQKHSAHNFCVEPASINFSWQQYRENDVIVHELELCRKDGERIWVRNSAHAIFGENEQVLYIDGTIENITERKRVEEELGRERNLLRTLIDSLPDRVYVKNLLGQKVLSNPADWGSIGAKSDQEVLGKTDFDLMDAELAERFWADDQQVMQSSTPLINRVEPGPDHTGERRWILTTKTPLYDTHGEIVGLVGIGRDITERRQIEEALHIANQKLTQWVDELEKRNYETRLLNDMGELLQSCHFVKDAYEVIRQFGARMFKEQSGELYILNSTGNLLEMVASWNIEASTIPAGECVANTNDCWAIRRGRVHLVSKPENRLRCQHLGRSADGSGGNDAFFPFICVPMFAQGETLGMMHVRFSSEAQALEQEPFVVSVAERAALALANLKLGEILRSQAVRDPLTGLFNRRYMEETLEREIRRAIRYDRPLGVIMLDIDYFKTFNDTFSYAAGDTLLRELGNTLKTNLRADDVTCRYGGEEFILILPESSLDDTTRRAEQLREACKKMNVYHREQPLGLVTISLGVAAYPVHGQTPEALLRAVDTALHYSKAQGRDQVTSAQIFSNHAQNPD